MKHTLLFGNTLLRNQNGIVLAAPGRTRSLLVD